MEVANTKNKWLILSIVLMFTFMAGLDGSIVNVALPNMSKALNVTTSSIQLVATSYLITISGLVLVLGRLGDMFGKTRVFTWGMILFIFGSLLCGIANTFVFLIIARVVQAIGAAGAMANNQGIVTEVFPKNERGKALGLLGTSVALGALIGPGLGGLIVGVVKWEYIFLINIPIGLIALVFALKVLPKGERKKEEKLDWTGAILFMLSIVPLFSAISEGVNRGFTDPIILLGFAVSIISFIVFIIIERRKKYPLVELGIFKNKLFSLSIFCGFITFIAIFCSNIVLPFYLQDVMEYSPQSAGLILMIYPLILTVVAPLSGYLSDKIGSEKLTFVGLSLISLGLLLMAVLNENSALIIIVVFIGIMSFGMGLFQSPNNSLVMSSVSRDKLGVAGSINALVRNVGMVSGIAIATSLLYSGMSAKIGYPVTSYIAGRNDAFIYGMRIVYIAAAVISFIGAVLTFARLRKKER